MIQAVHLKGKYHSGRVVHVKMLDSAEIEDNQLQSGKLLDKDNASYYDLKKIEWKNGLRRFVIAVSDPVTEMTKETKVRKVTPMDLDASFAEFFTSKDAKVLEQMYRDYHEVSQEEIENIAGKALTVSEG